MLRRLASWVTVEDIAIRFGCGEGGQVHTMPIESRQPIHVGTTPDLASAEAANPEGTPNLKWSLVLTSIMNSVLSLTGAAHRYRRKDFAAEIRVGER